MPMVTKLRLSPSRASDFRTCPQLYKFRVVDRLPEPPSEPQLRGTIVHKALELLFALPASERTREAASKSLLDSLDYHRGDIKELSQSLGKEAISEEGSNFPNLRTSCPPSSTNELTERIRSAGEKLLDNYFKLEDPASVEPLATEKWVSAVLFLSTGDEDVNGASQTELVGVIDRLERSPSGRLLITDYKTGSAPPKNYERDAFFGLRFYSLILAKLGKLTDQPPRIRLFYLQDAEVIEEDVTDATIAFTSKLITAVADAIKKALDTGDWRPNPGPLCDYCSFRRV
ncbi:MAG: recombinase RecB, partial [Acidimicrobiia bacterium]